MRGARRKARLHCQQSRFPKLPGDDLPSQDPAVQVFSALEVLTSVFGMGTGGTPPA